MKGSAVNRQAAFFNMLLNGFCANRDPSPIFSDRPLYCFCIEFLLGSKYAVCQETLLA
jgi:hypothetical protein